MRYVSQSACEHTLLTNIVSSPSVSPMLASSVHVAQPSGRPWRSRLGRPIGAGTEPTHPADHLRGINPVARHIDDFEKGSQAAGLGNFQLLKNEVGGGRQQESRITGVRAYTHDEISVAVEGV